MNAVLARTVKLSHTYCRFYVTIQSLIFCDQQLMSVPKQTASCFDEITIVRKLTLKRRFSSHVVI